MGVSDSQGISGDVHSAGMNATAISPVNESWHTTYESCHPWGDVHSARMNTTAISPVNESWHTTYACVTTHI